MSAGPLPRTTVVVPCYNEAARLPTDAFVAFAEQQPNVDFLFVDDGSTDDTVGVLRGLAGRAPERFALLEGGTNRGKAEAVRLGMREALGGDTAYAGYWDADLATPLDEIPRFVEALEERPGCSVVFGARVKLLGRSIERRAARHYLGRVFATVASTALALPIYDTQCGAKLFRSTPQVRALFDEPFSSRWIFDVEIVARMVRAARSGSGADPATLIYELPLREWRDVAGSKVKPTDFLRAIRDIERIRRRYLRGAPSA